MIAHIQKFLPSFSTIFDKEDVCPIMFEFGNYLINNYQDKDIIKGSALFIDDALCKGGEQVEDLVVLQVFQLLYENKSHFVEFEALLSLKAREVYERFYNEWMKW